jgi:DNA mismatch repair protein MutS2
VLEGDKAVIARGGLRIEVSPARLRRASPARPISTAPKVSVIAERSEAAELNLVGMRTSDALRKLEEFLDQAYLTSKSEVRVVHGIGSGILSKAIREYLGSSPYCASFREAEPHHGGAGATIIQIAA